MVQLRPAGRLPLTDACHHYTAKKELPYRLHKYWHQRYDISSLYDEGIHLTNDAWFGITPEPIARRVAEDFHAQNPTKEVVIDCFAGAGGNAIAFALSGYFSRVIAIERDPSTLACAQHNAELYGLGGGEITWVLGDSFAYMQSLIAGDKASPSLHPELRVPLANTAVFASPPWGGPGYRDDPVFDLTQMQPYGLNELASAYHTFGHALYLPRTSDVRQLAALSLGKKQKMQVTQYCLHGAAKAMVAYIPARQKCPARIVKLAPPPLKSIIPDPEPEKKAEETVSEEDSSSEEDTSSDDDSTSSEGSASEDSDMDVDSDADVGTGAAVAHDSDMDSSDSDSDSSSDSETD